LSFILEEATNFGPKQELILPIRFIFLAWASADFFPREGKIFPGGEGNILFALKMLKNILFSFKKSRKTYYFG